MIQEAAPEAYDKRIKRQGIVNAWDDLAFAAAVRNTGKKQLLVAGVTTDVCLVPPASSMQGEGFHIKVRFSDAISETCVDWESVCLMPVEVQRLWQSRYLGSDSAKPEFP